MGEGRVEGCIFVVVTVNVRFALFIWKIVLKVMGGCNSTSRNGHKITLGKNKSFSILKDTIKKGKMTYTISFYFDE